jgi:hypothetical protein
MDFIVMAEYLWDLLIMGLLPVISLLLAFIFIYKILAAMQVSVPKFMQKTLRMGKSKVR